MPFIDEIATHLEQAGVAVWDVNMFISSRSDVPTGPGPFLSLRETGGLSPVRTHNRAPENISRPAYQRPAATIVARAKDYNVARLMARRAYSALVDIVNEDVGAYTRAIVGLTRVGTTATAVTGVPHRLQTDQVITVSGAVEAAYNITVGVEVVDPVTFTYQVGGSPPTPATGGPVMTYAGGYYLQVNLMQEPFDYGLDQQGRARVTFNIQALKRPS